MIIPDFFSDYPGSFPSHSRASAREYHIRVDCFAGLSSASALQGMSILATLPAEGISVFAEPYTAMVAAPEAECRPVYALSTEEPPAIPTGRVFVEGARDVNLATLIMPLGYEVESVPAYAPHAAWLVASDGRISSALSNLQALMAATGLESVEPQMLRPASYRGRR